MIILRRNKKIVELFPIGSSKEALNSRRKPLFYGYLKLKSINEQIRPYKFIVKKGDKESLFPPSEALKVLKKQNVYLIGEDDEIENMLNSLNINFKKTRICKHCTLEGYITIINRNSTYLYHNEYICRLCAEEEIKRELKYKGIDLSVFNNFKGMLDKTGDFDKVLSIFDPKFNPVKSPDLTLFDKVIAEDSNAPNMKIDDINVPEELKKILEYHGKHLLPVQYMAVQNGLIEGENLLIVSATASGKTLIGEIAGVPNAMKGKKFVFLTPLVALANQKYRNFKKKYGKLGLKVAIKVGMSRIKSKEELTFPDDDIKNADIVVGTYEGLDFMLRSGKSKYFGEIGTVVIDEIHMLDDEERGPRLNGLIKRIKSLFKGIQIIGLSATVQNPEEIADEFSMKLVKYDKRPVPLERHLIFAKSEFEKMDIMTKLSRVEYKDISKKGFHGQTIIFTNSRRKTHFIANYLTKRDIKAAAYHAGLSYSKKSKIEKEFADQKISSVVTTAALAAGVDFPASQVIFEGLIMGNKWLTNNEFSQMLGRAGRPSYHDKGKVYLIPEVGKKYGDKTEDMQAVSLLESDVDNIYVQYSEDDVLEQLLADICSGRVHTLEELKTVYKNMDLPLGLEESYDIIYDAGLVRERDNNIFPTKYGRAVSTSFLDLKAAEYIKRSINLKNREKNKKHFIDPIEISLKLEPFENAYMSNRLNKKLSKGLNINLPTKLFADSTLDILSSAETVSRLDSNLQDALINLQIDFMSCRCQDRPFCRCFQEELSMKILKQRLHKKDPVDISKKLLKNYQIHSYAGDIFSWLDSIIKTLESIRRISNAFKNYKVAKECSKLIKAIEN